MNPSYLVAGSKSWNRSTFEETLSKYSGSWYFVDRKQDLTLDYVRQLAPHYIFFLHWSWKVPIDLIRDYECVCFHMTDVPYGRGGSPLQNLIVRGHRQTKLTALRMVEALDAGPVYMKRNLCLEGSAEEIYMRASALSADMIREIINEQLEPVPQVGDPVAFRRRTPAQSTIPKLPDLQNLHDFIRMLDAETYPPAFLEHAGFRYEFTRAAFRDGHIVADVVIKPIEEAP